MRTIHVVGHSTNWSNVTNSIQEAKKLAEADIWEEVREDAWDIMYFLINDSKIRLVGE